MLKGLSVVTWDEALRGFVLHKKAVRAKATARWYSNYCSQFVDWVKTRDLPLDSFTKRHLNEYLVFRSEAGKSATTLHHDALTVCVFMEWCWYSPVCRTVLITTRSAGSVSTTWPSREVSRSPKIWLITKIRKAE